MRRVFTVLCIWFVGVCVIVVCSPGRPVVAAVAGFFWGLVVARRLLG